MDGQRFDLWFGKESQSYVHMYFHFQPVQEMPNQWCGHYSFLSAAPFASAVDDDRVLSLPPAVSRTKQVNMYIYIVFCHYIYIYMLF